MRLQVFTVGIVQIVGWWVLPVCSCMSWHQCFGERADFILLCEGIGSKRMWCSCVSTLQQMRAVRIMGRWEGVKETVGSALLQLLLAQTEVSVLSALSGVLTGHISCNLPA
jgi:hypothetical protein